MNIIGEIRNRAQAQPDHPALISDAPDSRAVQTVSYAQLITHFDEIAAELRSLDCNPCQRVGLLAKQGAGFIETALGILAADLCFVPISEDYHGSSLQSFAKRTQLHYLIRQSPESGKLETEKYENVQDVDGQGDREFRALQPAYIRFTSGTTNERKGVIIGHQSILDRLHNANEALAIGPDDRIMWMLPMAHHFVVSILLYLRYGATILLPHGYLAETVLNFSNSHGATVFYASPYHYDLLAQDSSELKLPNVRIAISTASGLNTDIAERFFNRMGIPLSQALGIIEVGLPAINLQRPKEKPLSLGQVLTGYEVWLRDEDGQLVSGDDPENATGEICIRGSGCFDAYMDPWVPAVDFLNPDGFRTGDEGFFDRDSDLFLRGRRRNRINMAGMKFWVEEVEAILNVHPAIKESRIYGQTHAHLGEIPIAELVANDAKDRPTPAEFIQFCKQHIADHKVPFKFNFVAELPRTSTGKIRRW